MIRPFDDGIFGMRRAGSVAGLADRYRRVRLVRRMQAERMERMREMFALELMAGDADALADGRRLARIRIASRPCALAKPAAGCRAPPLLDPDCGKSRAKFSSDGAACAAAMTPQSTMPATIPMIGPEWD